MYLVAIGLEKLDYIFISTSWSLRLGLDIFLKMLATSLTQTLSQLKAPLRLNGKMRLLHGR